MPETRPILRRRTTAALLSLSSALALALPAPAALARDSLGMFGNWGAFRDAHVPRCYAIAMADPHTGIDKSRTEFRPYADVASWPRRGVRGQVHFRLSRRTAPNSRISAAIGGQHFQLVGGGGEAWAADRRMDAAIVSLIRSSATLYVSARDTTGHLFTDTFRLEGAATAMDAAAIGCAQLR